MKPTIHGLWLAGLATAFGSGATNVVRAQTFQVDTTNLPQGAAFNGGFTENVELFDIDGDGDPDCLWANGGEMGNEQNRLWINRGFAQGGAPGLFRDETSTRYPALLDDSRDIDFVDLDADGDWDLFVANTSGVSNQSCHFLVNMGGAQGGQPGYFQVETSTRYVHVGQNDGVSTHSSVAATVALAGGGYIDWSCDSTFLDLDNDGDPDLVQATYGNLSLGRSPARVFLNDGSGHFEEFNPSGYQLMGTDIPNGAPGLWCEGVLVQRTLDVSGAECDISNESISVDGADLDGDFDLDFLLGDKTDEARVIRNRSVENGGVLAFRDVSGGSFAVTDWAPSQGSYEQDLADFDNDGDIDIYGVNWDHVCDTTSFNDGAAFFGTPVAVANSCVRHNEPDFIDYDNDGWLDVMTVSRTAPEELYRNSGPGSGFAFISAPGELPSFAVQGLGADACDTDLDGDYDLLIANDFGDANTYLRNVSNVADAHAPRVASVEQAPSRNAGPTATVIRAHVHDNASWYVTAFNSTTLEYSVNGGAFVSVPMRFSGGQVFRGEISGWEEGAIDYRVRSIDAYGNVGVSATKSFVAQPCTGDPEVYCTAKVNSSGCTPAIGFSGVPSVSAGSGFVITAEQVLDNKAGLLFYSTIGSKVVPYQGGYLCVKPPTVRTGLLNSGASGLPPCTGAFAYDFNAHIASGANPAVQSLGVDVWVQFWSRDPLASFQTNRTDALHFFTCP